MPFNISKLQHYYRPKSIGEACALLSSNQGYIALAGGSAIYIFSSKGLLQDVEGFVSLNPLPLNKIESSASHIEVGATVTHQQLLESQAEKPVVLDEALLTIPKEVRSVGTLGGQLCTCFPNFDLNVALLALDAEVKVVGEDHVRDESVEEFFRGVLNPHLEAGEIVTGVKIPKKKHLRSGYSKSALTAHGFSLLSAGVALTIEDGLFEDVRVAVGGTINTAPVRLKRVEDALSGRAATRRTVEEASELAQADGALSISSDFKTSVEYKRRLASVLIRRLILRLAGL